MKTIKTLLFVLLSTLLLSCSETTDTIFEEVIEIDNDNVTDVVEPEEDVVAIEHYTLTKYYNDKINFSLNKQSDVKLSGNRVIIQSTILKQVGSENDLDSLIIDLTGIRGINELVFSGQSWNDVYKEFKDITYFEIINLEESPNLKIIINKDFGDIHIDGSNLTLEQLNEMTEEGTFQQIDVKPYYKRSFTLNSDGTVDDYGSEYIFGNFIGKEIGHLNHIGPRQNNPYKITDKVIF